MTYVSDLTEVRKRTNPTHEIFKTIWKCQRLFCC